MCHEPHRARVDASDCAGCHNAVAAKPEVPRAIRDRLRRIAPFDTTRALRRETSTHSPPPVELWSHRVLPAQVIQPDTFSHAQHTDLSCLTCHVTRTGHGRLTFEPPRGCQICHHQAPTQNDCAECHSPEELHAPLTVTARFTVAEQPEKSRDLSFDHGAHVDLRCTECHTEAVTLAPGSPVATCTSCHEQHHEPARSCAGCHGGAPVEAAHAPPVDAHVSCDACHQPETVAQLLPNRAFCITCHQPQARDHYADRECTVCHFQASPEAFRPFLLKAKDGS
jgi:hypothetical protein